MDISKKMTLGECRAIRYEIVHFYPPEWRCNGTKADIPRVPGARLYWKARNGSKGVRKCLANLDEDTRCSLKSGYAAASESDFVDDATAKLMWGYKEKFEQAKRAYEEWQSFDSEEV